MSQDTTNNHIPPRIASHVQPVNLLLPLVLDPNPIPRADSELGLHVTSNIKDKIKQGQYVELASLLAQPEQLAHRLVVDSAGNIGTVQSNNKSINNIDEWSDAFLIYASIYLSAHPQKVQEVLKYFSIIRLAAKKYMGSGWKSYDIHFRLRLGSNPDLSFATMDQELWLLCMGPPSDTSSGKKCYDCNYRTCIRTFCPYTHCCLICSGTHQARACRRAAPSSMQRPLRPLRRGPTPFRPRFMAW